MMYTTRYTVYVVFTVRHALRGVCVVYYYRHIPCVHDNVYYTFMKLHVLLLPYVVYCVIYE